MQTSPAVMVLGLLLAGVPGCAAPKQPATIHSLQGTWQMQIDNVPVGARIPTLSVGHEGRISGKSGVNNYNATLDLAALQQERFKVGVPRMTRMASTPEAMALERDFLQRLQQADAAHLHGGMLTLEREGTPILRLLRVGY